MVVLVNGKTASAAEIVAGALQDHDRAIIVGETTYGKGLVQQLQQVGGDAEGLQMKFMIGKYYTPSGRCIQSKVYNSRADGGLGTDESVIKNEDRKVFLTEHGRQVRDGGGIEPDVVKKEEASGALERELMRKDVFYQFADSWEAKHLKDGPLLAARPSTLATDQLYEDFQKFVQSQKQLQVESPFEPSLAILQTALAQTGYDEAIADVTQLQTHLRQITASEFKKNEKTIKKRLDLTLRQRFIPTSILDSFALVGDLQVEEAFRLASDSAEYDKMVTPNNNPNPQTGANSVAQAPAPARLTEVDEYTYLRESARATHGAGGG